MLQEISARITIVSGLTLGEAFLKKFGSTQGKVLAWLTGLVVIGGCAAYQAGNILGAVAGLELISGQPKHILTVSVTALAFIILWIGGKNWIGWMMTLLVAVMGIAFSVLAVSQPLPLGQLLTSATIPKLPAGTGLLALGLVGTTIVPYNIFIGSGISRGETLPLMRTGLAIAIGLGGFITAMILLAGSAIGSFDSFETLHAAMVQKLGPPGGHALAWGLFAAGFSSAVTAPFAASIVVSNVFGWQQKTASRGAWMAVLLVGFTFGISGIKPIPVILVVQALNGLILPLLTFFLLLLVNDNQVLPPLHQPRKITNAWLLMLFGGISLIGFSGLFKTLASTWQLNTENNLRGAIIASVLVVVVVGQKILRKPRL